MLPLHKKQKLEDVDRNSFPYKFVKPTMFVNRRARFSQHQIRGGGLLTLLFFLWLIFRGGNRVARYKSPYAVNSHYLGNQDFLPIVDITIEECTRWTWFQSRSICTKMLEEGWEISGGDVLLDLGKNRVHLFVNRQPMKADTIAITDIQIAPTAPKQQGNWEPRPGGIWISRRTTSRIKDAITAVDFVHGKTVRELRRGRQFAEGGPLLLGQEVNLSYRKGVPPAREIPVLKISNQPYKVLQVAGTISNERRLTIRFTSVNRCRRMSRRRLFISPREMRSRWQVS